MCELRSVPELRAPREGVQRVGGDVALIHNCIRKTSRWKMVGQKVLMLYSSVLTVGVGVMLFAAAEKSKATSFDEITVHRINVVEPDGTLRMVISNHAELPGIIVRGKERQFERPQAGL